MPVKVCRKPIVIQQISDVRLVSREIRNVVAMVRIALISARMGDEELPLIMLESLAEILKPSEELRPLDIAARIVDGVVVGKMNEERVTPGVIVVSLMPPIIIGLALSVRLILKDTKRIKILP